MSVESIYSDPEEKLSERPQLLVEISHFVSRMMQENDLVKIAKETMRTISEQFKMTEMVMALRDEEAQRFKLIAAYGYLPDVEKEVLSFEYGSDWITKELQEKFRIAEDIYYINAEDWNPEGVDDLLLDKTKEIDKPREYEDQWLEKDFFEFVLRNHKGDIIGTMELNDSEETTLPKFETLLSISIFIKAAGILFENARMREKQKDTSMRIESLSSLMSKDLGKTLENSLRLFESLQRAGFKDDIKKRALQDVSNSMEKSLDTIERVQKLRNIESRPYSLSVLIDVMRYVKRAADKIEKQIKSLKISVKSEKRAYYLKCDPSLEELISASFDAIISLKRKMDEEIIVEVTETPAGRGPAEIRIAFTSGDIDFGAWRKLAIGLRSTRAGLRRMPTSGDMFAYYLITSISQKDGGKALIEERSKVAGRKAGALNIALPILK